MEIISCLNFLCCTKYTRSPRFKVSAGITISLLIHWYKRHGYSNTEKRKPFTEDARTGKHLQPLKFSLCNYPCILIHKKENHCATKNQLFEKKRTCLDS